MRFNKIKDIPIIDILKKFGSTWKEIESLCTEKILVSQNEFTNLMQDFLMFPLMGFEPVIKEFVSIIQKSPEDFNVIIQSLPSQAERTKKTNMKFSLDTPVFWSAYESRLKGYFTDIFSSSTGHLLKSKSWVESNLEKAFLLTLARETTILFVYQVFEDIRVIKYQRSCNTDAQQEKELREEFRSKTYHCLSQYYSHRKKIEQYVEDDINSTGIFAREKYKKCIIKQIEYGAPAINDSRLMWTEPIPKQMIINHVEPSAEQIDVLIYKQQEKDLQRENFLIHMVNSVFEIYAEYFLTVAAWYPSIEMIQKKNRLPLIERIKISLFGA